MTMDTRSREPYELFQTTLGKLHQVVTQSSRVYIATIRNYNHYPRQQSNYQYV